MVDIHRQWRTLRCKDAVYALLVLQSVCNGRKTPQGKVGRVVDGIRNVRKLQTLLTLCRDADEVLGVAFRRVIWSRRVMACTGAVTCTPEFSMYRW